MTLLTDKLKALVGTTVTYEAKEEIGRSSIRYFAIATRNDNPLHLDDEYAKSVGYPSLIAPATFIVETCQYAHRCPDKHGYIGHTWDISVHGCRMIRAGNDYEFIRPIFPIDRISVSWTLEDMAERRSSRGGTQLFVTSVARYYDSRSELVAVNRETLVYQPI